MTCFLSLLHGSLLTSNLCLPVIWYHGFLPTPRAPALTQTLQGSNTTANWPLGHPWSYNTILQSLSKPVPHQHCPQKMVPPRQRAHSPHFSLPLSFCILPIAKSILFTSKVHPQSILFYPSPRRYQNQPPISSIKSNATASCKVSLFYI